MQGLELSERGREVQAIGGRKRRGRSEGSMKACGAGTGTPWRAGASRMTVSGKGDWDFRHFTMQLAMSGHGSGQPGMRLWQGLSPSVMVAGARAAGARVLLEAANAEAGTASTAPSIATSPRKIVQR